MCVAWRLWEGFVMHYVGTFTSGKCSKQGLKEIELEEIVQNHYMTSNGVLLLFLHLKLSKHTTNNSFWNVKKKAKKKHYI